MRIRLLGTGTPTPSLKRKSSGYMVEIGDDVILFDHGPGSYHRLLEARKRPQEVTHVFFSHLHYDHCADYPTLVLTHWDQGAGLVPDLKVYGPPPIRRMSDLLFSAEGVFGPDLTARTRNESSIAVYEARGGKRPRKWPTPVVTELRSGMVVRDQSWSVTARAVVHVQPHLACLGFRLDTGTAAFAYSGDTGPCPAMVKLARDCDVLVHMCHFLSGTLEGTPFGDDMVKKTTGHLDLARIAEDAGVKNLVISHVTEQIDVAGVRERLIVEMSRIYGGNIFFGEDLMEIPVAGPQPRILD